MQLSDLRVRLDQMTERIVMRLKDRSRFPINQRVYQPDGIPIDGRKGISFLEFALEGLEASRRPPGRHSSTGEYPLVSRDRPASTAPRTVGAAALPAVAISIKDD